MLTNSSTVLGTIVSMIGLLISVVSAWGLLWPTRLLAAVQRLWEKPWSMIFAMAVRLALGLFLVVAAPDTRFPLAVLLLAAMSIIAAVILPFAGHDRVARLFQLFRRSGATITRTWLLFGMLLGIFLIVAARCSPLSC